MLSAAHYSAQGDDEDFGQIMPAGVAGARVRQILKTRRQSFHWSLQPLCPRQKRLESIRAKSARKTCGVNKFRNAIPLSLGELQLRKGARFIYEYDLNIPWEHEVRLEAELPTKPGRVYPYCVEGHAPCPPEDCRGIADFLARRDAWVSEEGLEDLAAVADFVDQVVLRERRDLLKDDALIEEMRNVLERAEARHSWQGKPFSRKAVNARLKNGDHLALMHQQW